MQLFAWPGSTWPLTAIVVASWSTAASGITAEEVAGLRCELVVTEDRMASQTTILT
jgi:hypothetical protein